MKLFITNAYRIDHTITQIHIPDHEGSDNSSSSGDDSDPITEIRFVPENKASCKYDVYAGHVLIFSLLNGIL